MHPLLMFVYFSSKSIIQRKRLNCLFFAGVSSVSSGPGVNDGIALYERVRSLVQLLYCLCGVADLPIVHGKMLF